MMTTKKTNNSFYHNNKNKNNKKGSMSILLPSSLRIISSCIKTVSNNATTVVASTVKSLAVAAASSVASAASDDHDHKEQVIWAAFDKLELSSTVCKRVLLLGYQTGFQVLDVEDTSNFTEVVSRRDDGPVTFLQMQPIPLSSKNQEGFRKSFPLLLVVGGDESKCSNHLQSQSHVQELDKDNSESHVGNLVGCSKDVRFYSLKSHCYVHVLRFRSAVYMVRCSPRIVAVGLETQVYCFDALTLENKFSVLSYPVPQVGGLGKGSINIGYGPMAVGPRWLAYASNDPMLVNTGRLSAQFLNSSPVISPSTSPLSGGLVAHYAKESGKHLAAGLVKLGDRGYKSMSKYCQEKLPDDSTSASRSVRSSSAEIDNAGVVVVKDFVSRAVISQFRAHSTPISALCFDPSGTLLVTASVYGNSINIFRIMPLRNHCGSGSQTFDWSSSYVHLYSLRRGIRAAIIQDICFSCHSQWVTVVSSKGTCHVFALSPFGGDVGFQTLNSHSEEHSVAPVLSSPWWTSSLCDINQSSMPPPPPQTLSVVSRIRDNDSGLLNCVSNAAATVSRKVAMPSGALAAVFHNSMSSHQTKASDNALEHLLVYTPSGHVVQHEIKPSFGEDKGGDLRPQSNSVLPLQDAGLSITSDPVQWWDVCRRSNWPDREDFVWDTLEHRQEAAVVSDCSDSSWDAQEIPQNNGVARSSLSKEYLSKPQGQSHQYLSNAEVQYGPGNLPIWKRSKVTFGLIGSPRAGGFTSGEYEIEKLPFTKFDMRRKDLLPVFDHFHSMRAALSNRRVSAGRYSNAFPIEPVHSEEKGMEEAVIFHSKPASFTSTESSDGGSSRGLENLHDSEKLNSDPPFYMPSHENLNEYFHGGTTSICNGVSLLDDSALPPVSLPSEFLRTSCIVLPASTRNSLSMEVDKGLSLPGLGCRNEVIEFDLHISDAAKVHGDGRPSTGVHDSVRPERVAFDEEDRSSMSHREEDRSQVEDELFRPMVAFTEAHSQRVAAAAGCKRSEAARNHEVCHNSGPMIGKSIQPGEFQDDEEEDYDDMALGMFALPQNSIEMMEPNCIDAVQVASIAYANDDLNEEEGDMFGGMFAFFEDGNEQPGVHRQIEPVNSTAVNYYVKSSKGCLNQEEEEDMLGGLFSVVGEDRE